MNVQLSYPSEFVAFAAGPTPPDGQNFAKIVNPDYARLSSQAARTPTKDGGCELWGKAEQALFDAVDVVPVSNNVIVTYADKAKFSEGVISPAEPTSIRMYAR